MMTTTSLEDLMEFLKKNKIPAEIEKESQQVATAFYIGQKRFPLFLKALDQGNLLQILIFIPSYLKPNNDFSIAGEKFKTASLNREISSVAELSRLLHLLNKELDIPGFGIDEQGGSVYYRAVLQTPKNTIQDELLLNIIRNAQKLCASFLIPIEAMSAGVMTLQQFIEKTKELKDKQFSAV